MPADPIPAPPFAATPPGKPARLASWLGEVFGGPPYRSDQLGGFPLAVTPSLHCR